MNISLISKAFLVQCTIFEDLWKNHISSGFPNHSVSRIAVHSSRYDVKLNKRQLNIPISGPGVELIIDIMPKDDALDVQVLSQNKNRFSTKNRNTDKFTDLPKINLNGNTKQKNHKIKQLQNKYSSKFNPTIQNSFINPNRFYNRTKIPFYSKENIIKRPKHNTYNQNRLNNRQNLGNNLKFRSQLNTKPKNKNKKENLWQQNFQNKNNPTNKRNPTLNNFKRKNNPTLNNPMNRQVSFTPIGTQNSPSVPSLPNNQDVLYVLSLGGILFVYLLFVFAFSG